MKNMKLYLAIAYGLIWAVGMAFYLSGADYQSPTGIMAASVCMFFPLIATLVCQASAHKPLFRGIGIRWKVNRWWFVGWILMPAIALLVLLFTYWAEGADSFNPDSAAMRQLCSMLPFSPLGAVAVTVLTGMIAGITTNALFAFGEEIGWRGYLLHLFGGRHFISVSIVIGLIWGLWHAPLILMGHNYPQHPNLVGVLFMMLLCIPLSFILQYFRIKSGSVIVPAIMHGTFNALAGLPLLFADSYNDLLSGAAGLTGIFALLLTALIIFLFDRYVTRDRICTSAINFAQ